MAGAATVEKALDLLFHLHEVGMPLGLSEIGRDLELPKSSCHRLLSALVERDVVEQDAAGRYRPGLALLALGLGAQTREPVVQAARLILEEEARVFGETVFLVGRRRGGLRVLDKAEGSGFLRAAPGVGDLVPADVTAAGKLYRAFGSRSGSETEPLAESSGTPAAVEDEAVRSRGYATNRDAWIDGLSVLAVPIWQGASPAPGDPMAIVALGAASARFEEIGESAIAARLLSAAARVGERLAASGMRPQRSRRASSQRGRGREAR
ncbi:MAG: helix-turn-helix domain-containing protein [Deltaproteobacteria bacterium]|jgi:DNA-binding IclR family transcriptional regulator|nr:helix-turn-helix domain-containing protein [Deltaproteobacteria bacterium]